MAHWRREDLIAAGIIRITPANKDVQLATCYRCGKKFPESSMKEVGNEVFICDGCRKGRQYAL